MRHKQSKMKHTKLTIIIALVLVLSGYKLTKPSNNNKSTTATQYTLADNITIDISQDKQAIEMVKELDSCDNQDTKMRALHLNKCIIENHVKTRGIFCLNTTSCNKFYSCWYENLERWRENNDGINIEELESNEDHIRDLRDSYEKHGCPTSFHNYIDQSHKAKYQSQDVDARFAEVVKKYEEKIAETLRQEIKDEKLVRTIYHNLVYSMQVFSCQDESRKITTKDEYRKACRAFQYFWRDDYVSRYGEESFKKITDELSAIAADFMFEISYVDLYETAEDAYKYLLDMICKFGISKNDYDKYLVYLNENKDGFESVDGTMSGCTGTIFDQLDDKMSQIERCLFESELCVVKLQRNG